MSFENVGKLTKEDVQEILEQGFIVLNAEQMKTAIDKFHKFGINSVMVSMKEAGKYIISAVPSIKKENEKEKDTE